MKKNLLKTTNIIYAPKLKIIPPWQMKIAETKEESKEEAKEEANVIRKKKGEKQSTKGNILLLPITPIANGAPKIIVVKP